MSRPSKGSTAGGRRAASKRARRSAGRKGARAAPERSSGRRAASGAASKAARPGRGSEGPSGGAVERPAGGTFDGSTELAEVKLSAAVLSTSKGGGKAPAGTKEPDGGVGAFVRGLTETERVALIVRDELFAGSWESYRKDLEARAAGRPYVFKLASRIEDDLRAVEKLRRFERRHEVNLADYLGEGR